MLRGLLVFASLSWMGLTTAGANGSLPPFDCTNDPLIVDQWNLDGPYGIGCPQDWNYVQGDDVVIAFIGSGVQYTRREFRGKFAGGYNFNDPTEPPLPDAGRAHETKAASIAVARTNNDRLMAGVAGGWGDDRIGCRLFSIRVPNTFDASDVATAIDTATVAGCKVISLSLGYPDYPEELRRATLNAYAQGVNVVASKNYTWYPCSPLYPADLPDHSRVTAVGSYGEDGYRCKGGPDGNCGVASGCGYGIDLLAPGVSIIALDNTEDGYVDNFGATSAATPHVAGAMGLVRSWLGPTSQPEDAEWILKYSAWDPPDSSDGSNWTWDENYGHGELRVSKAFEQLGTHTLTEGTGEAQKWSAVFAPKDMQFFDDLGGPLDGSYTVYAYIVWCDVTYENEYEDVPYAWGVGSGSTGWDTTDPNYQLGYCEVKDGSQTETGCTVQTTVYHVYIPETRRWMFYPCPPKDVVFNYKVWGVVESRFAKPGVDTPAAQATCEISGRPNPFPGEGWVDFRLPQPGRVVLSICDVSGRVVRELVNEHRDEGTYHVVWDGRDRAGQPVATGIYLYQLKSGTDRVSRKMVVVE